MPIRINSTVIPGDLVQTKLNWVEGISLPHTMAKNEAYLVLSRPFKGDDKEFGSKMLVNHYTYIKILIRDTVKTVDGFYLTIMHKNRRSNDTIF
mgnify:FL=1